MPLFRGRRDAAAVDLGDVAGLVEDRDDETADEMLVAGVAVDAELWSFVRISKPALRFIRGRRRPRVRLEKPSWK